MDAEADRSSTKKRSSRRSSSRAVSNSLPREDDVVRSVETFLDEHGKLVQFREPNPPPPPLPTPTPSPTPPNDRPQTANHHSRTSNGRSRTSDGRSHTSSGRTQALSGRSQNLDKDRKTSSLEARRSAGQAWMWLLLTILITVLASTWLGIYFGYFIRTVPSSRIGLDTATVVISHPDKSLNFSTFTVSGQIINTMKGWDAYLSANETMDRFNTAFASLDTEKSRYGFPVSHKKDRTSQMWARAQHAANNDTLTPPDRSSFQGEYKTILNAICTVSNPSKAQGLWATITNAVCYYSNLCTWTDKDAQPDAYSALKDAICSSSRFFKQLIAHRDLLIAIFETHQDMVDIKDIWIQRMKDQGIPSQDLLRFESAVDEAIHHLATLKAGLLAVWWDLGSQPDRSPTNIFSTDQEMFEAQLKTLFATVVPKVREWEASRTEVCKALVGHEKKAGIGLRIGWEEYGLKEECGRLGLA